MRVRPLRIAALGAAFFTGSLALGVAVQSCSSNPPATDAGTDAGKEETGPCSDGTFQLLECEGVDGAPAPETYSDEACRSLDDAEHRATVPTDNTRAPGIDAPTEAQALPSATPFTFTWHPGTLARLRAPRAPTLADELRRWTTLIPAAEAHCPPFSGVGYAVIFRSGTQEVLRAETAHTRYTPTADAWMRLRAVRGIIDMVVEVARYNASNVVEGPVLQATARHFTIAP